MSILGSPIGSQFHCSSWVSDKLNKKMPLLIKKLESLNDAQSSFLLLLYCASFCKMVWYIRTIPPDLISDCCVNFDSMVLNCFEFLLGSGLSEQSLIQAQLGTKLGGLGLRASKTHSAAAYIASFFKSKSLVETFLSKPIANLGVEQFFATFNQLVADKDHLDSFSNPTNQRTLSGLIDSKCLDDLVESSNVVDKARLIACAMPHANAWIRALPIHQNKFSSLQWSISMKRWLGIPFFNQDALCPACQIQVMDIFGHHACVCPVKGDRIKRHNIIRDILFDFCSSAAWAPVKEKAFLFAGSAERPADIFIPNYSCGKSLVLDNAVTCPLQHKYVVNAAQSAGFACNDYADEIKSKSFESRVQEEGFLYLPAVFESFGGFSRDLPDFFLKLTKSISTRFDEPQFIICKALYEKLSCALMKSIASSISSRFPDFFIS